MEYVDSDVLSQDSTFRGRIRIAMVDAALVVVAADGSAGSKSRFNKRFALGNRILADPTAMLSQFTDAMVAGGTLSLTSTDEDIKSRLVEVADEMAGVRWDEKTT